MTMSGAALRRVPRGSFGSATAAGDGVFAEGDTGSERLRHWGFEHGFIATVAAVLTVTATYVSAGGSGADFVLLAVGILWIGLFFAFFTTFTKSFASLSEKSFLRRLFWSAFVVRILAVFLIAAAFRIKTGTLFEPQASDAMEYHQAGVAFAERISAGIIGLPPGVPPSDFGYVTFVGVFYFLFGANLLTLRVAQGLIGAWTAVFLYRVAKLSLGSGTARTVGSLCAFTPYYVYYSGLHLKETVMVYLIVVVFYFTLKIPHARSSVVAYAVGLVGSIGALFFFRTFAAVLLVGCVCFHLLIQPRGNGRVARRLFVIMATMAGIAFIVFSVQPNIKGEVASTWQRAQGQWDRELRDRETRGRISVNRNVFSQPVSIALATTGPLPNLVRIEGQEHGVIQYGFAWVRYAFALFALVGGYLAIRKGARALAVVLLFLMGYIAVLGLSGHATSHRFQLPTLAPWILLTGAGLHGSWKKRTVMGWWVLSLLLLAISVIVWNYLKIAIRIN